MENWTNWKIGHIGHIGHIGLIMCTLVGTAEANPNIAIVKYWGNRDEKLILPSEGSVSVTLDNQFRTKTTVIFDKKFEEEEVWINSNQIFSEDLDKIKTQFNFIRKLAKTDLKAKIVSDSIMPVSAGLASSSSGLCASAYAAASALQLNLSTRIMSIICRFGSGSACRSVYGGFVEWKKGHKADGLDSYAVQIASEKHWPEFRIIIGIVESGEKRIKSRIGMKKTRESSRLYPERVNEYGYLNKIIGNVKHSILHKEYEDLFEIAMRDSNNMHAIMMDTYPPLIYLNDVSKEVIYRIHDYNKGITRAGYSFDAGPNPTIFTIEKYETDIKEILEDAGIEKNKIFISKVGSSPHIFKVG